jgi:hypothetical protein
LNASRRLCRTGFRQRTQAVLLFQPPMTRAKSGHVSGSKAGKCHTKKAKPITTFVEHSADETMIFHQRTILCREHCVPPFEQPLKKMVRI